MDDAELVRRLKRYDAEVVGEVVSRYGAALHRYVAAVVGDHHLAEDIVSETYMRMLDRIGTYTYRGVPFRAWLFQIARNLGLNALRRERRMAGEGVLAAVVTDATDPERMVEAGEARAAVRDALQLLTEEQQQVVLLRFVAEEPTAEVARLLRKSEGSVKQLQLRALRSLARRLSRNGGADGHEAE